MIIILQADAWLSLDDISLILFCEQKLLLWAVVFGNHGPGKEIQKVVPSSNSTRCSACCFSGTLKNSSQPFLVFVLVSSGCDKYHRLCASTTESHLLTVIESQSPKSRCWQGWFLLRLSAWHAGSCLLMLTSHSLCYMHIYPSMQYTPVYTLLIRIPVL